MGFVSSQSSEPILDKEPLFIEFSTERGDIVRTYRTAVLKGDRLTQMFEAEQFDEKEHKEQHCFTQRKVYEDFVKRCGQEFPNLTILI